MSNIESHCIAFSAFSTKARKLINALVVEKKENLDKLDHDIKIIYKNPTLGDFKSFSSNRDDYVPSEKELQSLKDTFLNQIDYLTSFYNKKIREQEEAITDAKKIYEENGLGVVVAMADMLRP